MADRRAVMRFKLSPGATKEDVRKAYLKQAKILHPDVAAKKTTAAKAAEEFKKLQEDYEAALKLVAMAAWQKGGAPGRAAYEEAKRHRPAYTRTTPDDLRADYGQAPYTPGARPGQQSEYGQQPRPPAPPMTPAQRLRNAIIGGVGVFGAVIFFSQQRSYAGNASSNQYMSTPASAASREKAPEPTPDKDAPLPVIDLAGGVTSEPTNRQVSSYYKKRTSKSVIRVREDNAKDDYVSPAEPAKTRHDDYQKGEALQAYATAALSGQGFSNVSPTRPPKKQVPYESDEEEQRQMVTAFTEGRVVRRTDARADG